MIRMIRIPEAGVAVVFMTTALAIAGTRLIGAQLIGASDLQVPISSIKELAPLASVSFVPDKKGENPMPPAVPQVSEAVAQDGLSITIAPAKAVFLAKEPLAFVVTFKNVSKEPFMLFDANAALRYELTFRGVPMGDPWVPVLPTDILRPPFLEGLSKELQPGAAREIKLLGGIQLGYRGPNDSTPFGRPNLDAGKYSVSLTRKFTGNPALLLWPHRHWVGTLTTKPVEFTVAVYKEPEIAPVINEGLPDSLNGLSIAVKPAKAAYDMKEPVSFTVSFKNVSKKTLLLYNINDTMGYKIEFNGRPTAAPWGPWVPNYLPNHQKVREAPKASDSTALAPGETLDKKVVLNNGVLYVYRGTQAASPIPLDHHEAGKYRVAVGFKGVMNPAKVEWKDEHWIGSIAAQSTEFVMKPAGTALVVKGLSVTSLSDHLVFPGLNYPYFRVRFENVSGKDLSLFGHQYQNWTIHIKNKNTGAVQTWKHVPVAAAPAMLPVVLAAGKSYEEKIMLRPELFCIPPNNVGAGLLDRGKHEIVFEIDLREPPNGRAIVPAYWVGQIRTAPLEFTCGNRVGAAKER